MALRNAADGSIATTSIRALHAVERSSSQAPTPALSRPSTTPMTTPVSRSTNVLIHGSNRFQAPSSSRNQRTDRYRCSSIPRRRTVRSSTGGRRTATALRAAWTSHHDTPCARAVSAALRPEATTAPTRASFSRAVDRARRGTWIVDSQNVRRGQGTCTQRQRRLDHTTRTRPATGMSRTVCSRRAWTRSEMTPQVGQPGGARDSTRTRRVPSGWSAASMTR